MGMAGVTSKAGAGEAAVRAVEAGNDVVLNSPNQAAAFQGLREAVQSGRIGAARLDASVTRILRAKARVGLHRARLVDLNDLPTHVGTRSAARIADDVGARAITLVKDERGSVPLRLPREANVLFLSVVDYPAGWRIASPSRAFQPELRQRWPNTTAIELSDRATREEIELVGAMAPRYDAIVAAVHVRASSARGLGPAEPPPSPPRARTPGQRHAVRRVVSRHPYAAAVARGAVDLLTMISTIAPSDAVRPSPSTRDVDGSPCRCPAWPSSAPVSIDERSRQRSPQRARRCRA